MKKVISSLKKNQEAIISNIVSECPSYKKIIELGILPGKKIKVLNKAPFKGPINIGIEDIRIMISLNLASFIEVR